MYFQGESVSRKHHTGETDATGSQCIHVLRPVKGTFLLERGGGEGKMNVWCSSRETDRDDAGSTVTAEEETGKKWERSVFPLGTFLDTGFRVTAVFLDTPFLRTEETIRSFGLTSYVTQTREFHQSLLY